MNFMSIFALELIANIPVWLGFMAAAKLFYDAKERWGWSIAILYATSLVTAVLILLFEPLKLGEGHLGIVQPSTVIMLAIVLTGFGLPFLGYVGFTKQWATWKSDLVLAAVLGLLLTIGEAVAVQVYDVRILLFHSLSMMAAAAITLPIVRTLARKRWLVAIAGIATAAVIVSAVIVMVEYMPLHIFVLDAASHSLHLST